VRSVLLVLCISGVLDRGVTYVKSGASCVVGSLFPPPSFGGVTFDIVTATSESLPWRQRPCQPPVLGGYLIEP
jgi:hypothetical protein